MSVRNRWKLLVEYLTRRTVLRGQPVEFIVETTAKCNLFCPMCPREIFKQPNEDMGDEVYDAFLHQTAGTAESLMLIGLGEPFLDRKIFDRITKCKNNHISALISTNGTLLNEKAAEELLNTGIDHVTLSFDGMTKETFVLPVLCAGRQARRESAGVAFTRCLEQSADAANEGAPCNKACGRYRYLPSMLHHDLPSCPRGGKSCFPRKDCAQINSVV
jgi:MoaA/NifB/PqqE/SkfB family radical SAM enzyme